MPTVEIRLATPQEARSALRMALAGRGQTALEIEHQVSAFLRYAHAVSLDLSRLWVCLDHGRVVGACACIESPGRTALVLVPDSQVLGPHRSLLRRLVEQVVEAESRRDVRLLQCLLHPEDDANAAMLADAGFHKLATLLYLECDPHVQPTDADAPCPEAAPSPGGAAPPVAEPSSHERPRTPAAAGSSSAERTRTPAAAGSSSPELTRTPGEAAESSLPERTRTHDEAAGSSLPERTRTPAAAEPRTWRWITYAPERHREFADLILATYEASLDCPALSGLRHIDDIIAGHQAAGRFDPRRWLLLRNGDRAAGCILFAENPVRPALELVYMGVHPRERCHGVGTALLRAGLALARRERFDIVTVAVDEANEPALRLYRRHGFRQTTCRRALIRPPASTFAAD